MSTANRLPAYVVALTLGFSACEANLGLPQAEEPPCADSGIDSGGLDTGMQSSQAVVVPYESRTAIRENGSTLIWIEIERPLDSGQRAAGATHQNGPTGSRVEQWARERARETRAELLEGVLQSFSGRLPPATRLVSRYRHLNMVALEVSSEEDLDILARDPQVLGMWQDQVVDLHLDASLDLIGQPEAYDLGYRGAGTAVAVLDTGLD